MAGFIGATVVIALAHPPGAKVRGLIANVIERKLILDKGEPSPSNVILDLHTVNPSHLARDWNAPGFPRRRGKQHYRPRH